MLHIIYIARGVWFVELRRAAALGSVSIYRYAYPLLL